MLAAEGETVHSQHCFASSVKAVRWQFANQVRRSEEGLVANVALTHVLKNCEEVENR